MQFLGFMSTGLILLIWFLSLGVLRSFKNFYFLYFVSILNLGINSFAQTLEVPSWHKTHPLIQLVNNNKEIITKLKAGIPCDKVDGTVTVITSCGCGSMRYYLPVDIENVYVSDNIYRIGLIADQSGGFKYGDHRAVYPDGLNALESHPITIYEDGKVFHLNDGCPAIKLCKANKVPIDNVTDYGGPQIEVSPGVFRSNTYKSERDGDISNNCSIQRLVSRFSYQE